MKTHLSNTPSSLEQPFAARALRTTKQMEPRPRDETLDVLFDISQILQTGLDRETLSVLIGMTETGVNPEALAAVVKELRRESAALVDAPTGTSQPLRERVASAEAGAFAPPR